MTCRNGCECNTPPAVIGVTEHFRVLRGTQGLQDCFLSDHAAKRARDKRARGLRKRGYVVICGKVSFEDLARATDYTLKATAGPRA